MIVSVKSRQTIFLPGKPLSRNVIAAIADFVAECRMNPERNSRVRLGLSEKGCIVDSSCSKGG